MLPSPDRIPSESVEILTDRSRWLVSADVEALQQAGDVEALSSLRRDQLSLSMLYRDMVTVHVLQSPDPDKSVRWQALVHAVGEWK